MKKIDDFQELLEDIVHETEHQINQMLFALMQSSKILAKKDIDVTNLERNLAIATENANVVKLVTENARIFADKNYEANTPTKEVRLIDKVFRAYKQIGYRAKVNNIDLELVGKTDKLLPAYPCFDMLFYIFMENAAKYSPSNMEIEISIKDTESEAIVTVESFGPRVKREEISRLTERKFRGENAMIYSENGRGLGLHTAERICELHDIEMKFYIRSQRVEFNGTQFSPFVVEVKIPTL